MSSFNRVILAGNLTRDPEMRTLPSGSAVAALGLAVNRSYRKPDGEEVEETTFIDVDAFGHQAEVVGKYLHKGDPLMLEGRLRYRSWEDDSGQKRNKLNVVLEKFEFLPRGARQVSEPQDPEGLSTENMGGELDPDNVPF